MAASAPRRVKSNQSKVARVLKLFRDAIAEGDLDDHDWESLRVAVRIVYETEDLGEAVDRRATEDRNLHICNWSDSIEGALSFMSWTRELATVVADMRYSPSRTTSVGALWRRHRDLASRLVATSLSPAKRLSVLVELGGIEVALWGHTWALEPMRIRAKAERANTEVARTRKLPK
jgi:hypothetical protein